MITISITNKILLVTTILLILDLFNDFDFTLHVIKCYFKVFKNSNFIYMSNTKKKIGG